MYKTEVIGYTPIAKKLRTSAMNWKKTICFDFCNNSTWR